MMLKCPKCGHKWKYKGKSTYPTCPSCMRKSDIRLMGDKEETQ